MSKPSIGVIGSGPMGRGFATLLARAGYEVTLGTRRVDAPELDDLRNTVSIGSFRDAAESGDVVFIAIVHSATEDLLTDLAEPLAGKTLISSNNAWIPEHYEAAGLSDSLTEGSWMAAILPRTHVVRAFSHMDWQYLVARSTHPATYAVSYAVDDPRSEAVAVALIDDMGFSPYRIGMLAESAPLDVDGALWHYLFTPDQMRTTLAGTLTYSEGPFPPKLPDDASQDTTDAVTRHSHPRDPARYRAMQAVSPGAELTLQTVVSVEPGYGHVEVTVEACGVCHSDVLFVDGAMPELHWPVTPGHEVAGRISRVGPGVGRWQPGDRVAVGWFGGHCGSCDPCRSGDFVHCEVNFVTGSAFPGGYSESMVVPVSGLARIPDALTAVDAAPLACAGVTMFNSLRRSRARPGDLVAVLGLGGLGHLGVQFAVKMGFRTVAIARGTQKQALADELGAHHCIDSTASDVAKELTALGGATVIQATASNADAMSAAVDGLAPNGELLVLGITPDDVHASPMTLITRTLSVSGHPSGTAMDIEATLDFAALHGIRAISEEAPLERAAYAYRRMVDNQAYLRMVLTTGR